MNKNNFKEYISAYIDGELSSSASEQFEELMRSNKELENEYKSMEALTKTLASVKKLETGKNFMVDLNKRIDQHNKSDFSFSDIIDRYFILSKKPMIAISMSIVIILTISNFYTSYNNLDITTTEQNIIDNSIYYSDIDSSDVEVYEDEIQLTNGSE